MNINFFDPITISLPKNEIYARLGYAKGITRLKPEQRDKVERYIEDARALINLKGAGVRIPIIELTSSRTVLSKSITFKSKSLAELLIEAGEVLFIAATAGSKITQAISEKSKGEDVTAAVVFDAVASEMADGALDWIINYFNHELLRENRQVTKRRFSAGYGDFLLAHQKDICNVLNLKQLGITLTKNNIFIPEKTVTAVVGILDKR